MATAKNIAIDGPVASGKTSVGMSLAERLGYLFLDTGVMYRAAAWAAVRAGLDINDEQAVSELTAKILIEIEKPSLADGRSNDIFVDGEDVTWEIRKDYVNNNVSQVSTYKQVRRILTEQQRQFGEKGNVVMVGRDIGTVVLPDADLKIFLVASAEERARRRYEEDKKRKGQADYDQILANMVQRDQTDSSRKVAPLVAAADAVKVVTDGKSKDEVVEEIYQLALQRG
ncbi:MAG: CMP/dCMP kinase [Chloroflexota bacterium]|nr:CMP/dCMP kinase [Chloroflexota bacterium]